MHTYWMTQSQALEYRSSYGNLNCLQYCEGGDGLMVTLANMNINGTQIAATSGRADARQATA